MKKENQKKEEIKSKLDKRENKKEIVQKSSKKEKKINTDNKESIYHKYLWYLIIFSVIGLLIETIVCFTEKQISNSVFGLVLGPLCIVYGIGAIITIICLERFKGHKIKLFILGAILGILIEYVLSFILEAIFGARLWSYTCTKVNANGRICLGSAPLWGILTVILINVIKKYIDKLINKIQGKTRIIVDIILTITLTITIMLTIWGLMTYTIRARETLNGKNYTSNNNAIERFQNTVFSNELMEKIFKNLEITNNEGNWVLVKNING